MRKIKKEMIAILLILLALALSQNAMADVPGCCTNPGAGILACSEDTLVLRDSGCCPQPQSTHTEYYQSQTNPFGPLNYNTCVGNFFVADQGCAGVSACALGCCCSQSGGQVKPEAQCKGTGVTFFSGQTNCDQACPTPQCGDGINNDPANNNCADFPADLGCDTSSDLTESGGACTTQTLNCNDISYVPKLSNLQINPVQGQKKFSLIWMDDCADTAAYYDILRCAGSGCTNFAAVGVSNINAFSDMSQDLLLNTVYTYKVVAHYSRQTATPSITKTANLGSAECFGKSTSSVFCLNNKAFFCDVSNNLLPQGAPCTTNQVCVVNNNVPSCLNKSNCNPTDDNPFGMFFTQASCENGRYCFYDRSYTPVNSCFSCVASMSCYDYKTEETCARDNCRVGDCQWKSSANQIGVGACISTSQYNCQWCDKQGITDKPSATSQNTKYNNVFDYCTQDKANLLSVGNFKCYFNSGISKNCSSVACIDYDLSQCSNTQIQHNENNQIINPSPDSCGIKVCQNINNQCVKNADGDTNADCIGNGVCENDYFAPNTTILPVLKSGIVTNLLLQVYDKTSGGGLSSLKLTPDYLTYLCVEPCGSQGHPYDNFTASKNLILSNLKLFDSVTGSKLLTLNEGQNVLRYYSRDPSKNIEEVKKITVGAFSNTDGPRIFSVNISGSSLVSGKIFTNTQKPTINVQFVEPATVTFLKLTNKKTNSAVSIQGSTSLSVTAALSIIQNLQDGEYALDIDAQNENGISMKPPYTATIVVDSAKPNITIEPANNAVLSASLTSVKVDFNEEINLNSLSVKLNSLESKGNFTTADNKVFTASINLSDGNKNLNVTATDLAKNQASGSVFFVVDALPTAITLVQPKFGAASTYVFDVIIGTDNDATCKYAMDNLEYQFMDQFTTSGGTTHTINAFNRISSGDSSVHKLFVKCSDPRRGVASKSFDLSVDATPPQLIGAFAVPNPVVERPSVTTLKVESNEPVICKFSSASSNFGAMGGKFEGFDANNFKKINTQNITLENEGDYTYHLACENKAGLVSDPQDVQIRVDLNLPIIITSHTPEFFNSTSVVLAIDTNKISQCKYSEADQTVASGSVFGAPGYSHTANLVSSQGSHTFYVSCKDQYLQEFSDVETITFTVDTTPPAMLFVEELGTLPTYPQISCFKDKLRVKWLGQDEDSGIKHYFYSIFREGNQIILNSTRSIWYSDPQNHDEWTWIGNLNLLDNVNYFFKVQAVNNVDLTSPPKSSDGITVNVSRCNPDARCGDGKIDTGEECDGTSFLWTCLQYTNFIGGTLKCTNGCTVDNSNCERLPECGNGVINKGEDCDGTAFGQIKTCTDYNGSFTSGSLKCTTKCQLDTSSCIEIPKCGNGFINTGEDCDGMNLGALNGNCVAYSPSTYTGGTLSCKQCHLDTSNCQGVQGTCGDGILNTGEDCDGTIFGAKKTCAAMSSSFAGGELKCTATACQLDTSSCIEIPKCGNGFIDTGESCDKTNLIPSSGNCVDYSQFFKSGKLGCDQNCSIDTNACAEAPKCGNSALDAGEMCDGANFGNITDLSCSSNNSNFISGSLICKSCRIATDNCKSNNASILTCKDRGDCKLNDPCTDSSECASRYCFNGKCTGATCDDSIKNQGESDIDCGGPCDKCNNGKICSIDVDCQSNFCSFGTCREADECHDGRFSGHETDIDCGGPCPIKCSEGMGCGANEDCGENLKCISSVCKQCASGDENCDGASDAAKDSDGDGMTDDWEIQNGLNPDDPNDADTDSDNDGLTNIEEFRQRTDPNAADTDKDGFTDKREVDAETNPLDPEDFPKSSFLKTLLFTIGIIVVLSGLGYATYRIVAKKKEEELKSLKSAGMQSGMTRMIHQQPSRQISLRPRIDQPRLREALKRREDLKEKERKKMFAPFGSPGVTGQPPKSEQKPKEGTNPEKTQKTEESNPKEEKKSKESEAKKKSKEANQKKHKEDVFARLKKISKEGKKHKKKI